ncbi:MAG: shikimate dehydrogenase [Crocinitomicaceae bacterium]|nr:shikimate dehydrogenase [Crocinitomicaceae bacterium]
MKYALLGKTLSHSFSKTFFTEFFSKHAIDASYENREIKEIAEVKDVFNADYNGFNVTIPYKQAMISYLDGVSDEVKKIGAVNTVKLEDGKWIGYNTDAFGFQQSIKPFLTNLHEKAIIIGTGGASKAVAYVLKNIGISCIYISREPSGSDQFPYEALNEHMLKACKLVVNCTPVGTFPNVEDCVPFPFEYLSSDHLVVDLIYNPQETKFLHLAKNAGATVLNGESMLKEQALKAWEIWNK